MYSRKGVGADHRTETNKPAGRFICVVSPLAVVWRSRWRLHRLLFERIILVNPASAFHRSPWFGWASELVHWVPPFLSSWRTGVVAVLACLGCILPGDRQDLLKTMRSVPPETVLWRLSLVKEFDVDETQLRQLTQPVLVIASALDRLLPSITDV